MRIYSIENDLHLALSTLKVLIKDEIRSIWLNDRQLERNPWSILRETRGVTRETHAILRETGVILRESRLFLRERVTDKITRTVKLRKSQY